MRPSISERSTSTEIAVRRAGLEDVATLVDLRVAFLRELGYLGEEADVRRELQSYLERSLGNGSFVAWVAAAEGAIVATGGMVVYERLVARSHVGHEAYVLNVYTVPEWRRRGVAESVMGSIVAYAEEHHVLLALVATDDARGLYRKMGFRHDDRYFRFG